MSPHFAFLPAVLNADFVIVQSESVRQQYLAAWHSMLKARQVKEPEEHALFKAIQKKVLPLGSPKFDAVKNADWEDGNLPDNWKRLIRNPDSTRKKIIFYNTSISRMLECTLDADDNIVGRYLDKLESVLLFFRQRDDVVLLWRPHPLLARTFVSMRPELYQRYQQIVREYRREGYGI